MREIAEREQRTPASKEEESLKRDFILVNLDLEMRPVRSASDKVTSCQTKHHGLTYLNLAAILYLFNQMRTEPLPCSIYHSVLAFAWQGSVAACRNVSACLYFAR